MLHKAAKAGFSFYFLHFWQGIVLISICFSKFWKIRVNAPAACRQTSNQLIWKVEINLLYTVGKFTLVYVLLTHNNQPTTRLTTIIQVNLH